jgi:hypothetical protein
MAPERRRGKGTTPRTDVHALALVACEMVTGRLPGEGGGLDGVPARWQVPLRRGLEAEPERRPADPRELVASLGSGPRWRSRRWVALLLALVVLGGAGLLVRRLGMRYAGSTERRSIAVLSLDNLGSAQEDDYFGEGLAEDILTQLTRIRGLHVISRASTARFKGTKTPLREIAEKLGVQTVLGARARHRRRRRQDRIGISPATLARSGLGAGQRESLTGHGGHCAGAGTGASGTRLTALPSSSDFITALLWDSCAWRCSSPAIPNCPLRAASSEFR